MKPTVLHYFLQACSAAGLLRQHSLQQALQISGDLRLIRKCELLRANGVIDLKHRLCKKRGPSIYHVKDGSSERPDIRCIPFRRSSWTFLRHAQFRRYKGRSSGRRGLSAVIWALHVVEASFSEVSKLHGTVTSSQQVVRFDVSVNDSLAMEILEGRNNVTHDLTYTILSKRFNTLKLATVQNNSSSHILYNIQYPICFLLV
mmetsp:Transcript_11125/g.34108  ORF Transcript_11125/g.34108 Transcript_11125/m.34108 type:complete len:202 (+) Transcript_11125:409-1014(+)